MGPGKAPFAGPIAGDCDVDGPRGRGPSEVGVPTGEPAGPMANGAGEGSPIGEIGDGWPGCGSIPGRPVCTPRFAPDLNCSG